MTIALIVAGDPDQYTGGYLYDARIASGLTAFGWQIETIGLAGAFPRADARARQAMSEALAARPNDSLVIIDGLALGDLADIVARHRQRLRLIALVHHPLADEHGLNAAEAAYFREQETAALAQVERVIVTSVFTASRLQAYNVSRSRIDVVLPGVERGPLADAGWPPVRLLCVATLIPRKSHLVLVAALATLADLDWQCDCIGALDRDPDCVASVQQAINDAGLGERIRLVGTLMPDRLTEAYRDSDLFVLPSAYEGYGMVVTEALAHGLPVVTTTGGALADTLPDGAGLAVPAGDALALAQALHILLADRAAYERVHAGARAVRDRLDGWHLANQRFAAVLERMQAAA